jgi:hypothetical protein
VAASDTASTVPSDAANGLADARMVRLADARDSIYGQSNRFLVAGMVFAVLYGVKAIGLRVDLVISGNRIFELPYGLFVFCVLGAGSFLIAQTRFMDAHAVDRRMAGIAKTFVPADPDQYLQTFPAQSSWLRLSREQFFVSGAGGKRRGLWLVDVAGIGLLFLYLLPVFSCVHFLVNWRELADQGMPNLQWWVVVFALSLDVLFFILLVKIHRS